MNAYPKPARKKKRKAHPASIMQRKDGVCYLCAKLDGDYRLHSYLEEHHAFPGNPGRAKSEAEGLKVYLCARHHRTGTEAVHKNREHMRLVQRDAQKVYEQTHTREEWMKMIGRNYLDESEMQ